MKTDKSNDVSKLKLYLSFIITVFLLISTVIYFFYIGKQDLGITILFYFLFFGFYSFKQRKSHEKELKALEDVAVNAIEQSEKLVSLIEDTSKLNEQILKLINFPQNPDILKEKYLTIQDIVIYYIDEDIVNSRFQNYIGPLKLDRITTEYSETETGEDLVEVGGSTDLKVQAPISLASSTNLTIKNRSELTSQNAKIYDHRMIEESLEEKVLTIQSSMLRKNEFLLGCEYSLDKLNSYASQSDVDFNFNDESSSKTKKLDPESEEIARFVSLNGYVLLSCMFEISNSSSDEGCIELIYDHPSNEIYDLRIKYRIRIPSNAVKPVITMNVFKGQPNVFINTIGFIQPNQYLGKIGNEDSFINIIPIVIYSTEKRFSSLELLDNIVENREEQNKILKNQISDLTKQKLASSVIGENIKHSKSETEN